jgi:malate dehydrogenase
LISSFPVRSDGQALKIVQGVELSEFSRTKISETVAELQQEKSMVADLIGA